MNNEQLEAEFRLVACDREGRPCRPIAQLPNEVVDACVATAELYGRIGFHPPWIGYIAVSQGAAVGGGAFVAPPCDDRVEIAYFTLAACEGRGFGTRTAQGLISIARAAKPGIEVFAKTAPEQNASTAILMRHGFRRLGTTIDDEIGEAWAWLLK